MKYQNTRAAKRPSLSLRYGGAPRQAASGTVAPMIPIMELRRLVAAMVD